MIFAFCSSSFLVVNNVRIFTFPLNHMGSKNTTHVHFFASHFETYPNFAASDWIYYAKQVKKDVTLNIYPF